MKIGHRGEAEKSWQRRTAQDAKSSNRGKPRVWEGLSSRTLMHLLVDECRNEVADIVARYQFDKLCEACHTKDLNPLQRVVVSAIVDCFR